MFVTSRCNWPWQFCAGSDAESSDKEASGEPSDEPSKESTHARFSDDEVVEDDDDEQDDGAATTGKYLTAIC